MKKYLKKSLSVFLAFLMVLSCFVFAPEMFTFEADAAVQGKYYVKVSWNAIDGNNLNKNYAGIDGTQDDSAGMSLQIKNLETNTVTEHKLDVGSESSTPYMDGNHNGEHTWEGTYDGFPILFYACVDDNVLIGDGAQMKVTKIEVAPADSTSDLTTLWSGSARLQSSTKQKYVKIGLGDSTGTDSSNVANNHYHNDYDSDTSKDNHLSTTSRNWLSPTETTVEIDGSAELTVPGGTNAETSSSKFATTTVYDQYGVTLNKSITGFEFYDGKDRATATKISSIDGFTVASNVVSGGTDAVTATVADKAALKNWVATGSTATIPDDAETIATNRKIYVFAKYNDIYSTTCSEISITNPTYTWKFGCHPGKFADDSYSSTAENISYGQTIGSRMPSKATREGYVFGDEIENKDEDGNVVSYTYKPGYTGKDGNTYYVEDAAKTRVVSSLLLDAIWTPVRNVLEFYNYDGQLLGTINGRYDKTIKDNYKTEYEAIVAKATKPGDSAAESYTFDKFVNWDTSEVLDENTFTLKNTENGGVTRFIARYNTGESKKYTYNFYSAGKEITGTNGNGIYRSDVKFPSENPSKADDATADGKQYEFAGWIAKAAGTAPADKIVDRSSEDEATAKMTDAEVIKSNLAAGETYIAPDSEGNFHYYLKQNLVLYPVYIATYRNVKITLNYKNSAGEATSSNVQGNKTNNLTQCGKTYNLGVPTPLSYNKSETVYIAGDKITEIYSYTFIGWSETNHTPGEGTAEYPLTGGSTVINAELHDDLTLYAVYKKDLVNFTAYYYNEGELFGSDETVDIDKEFTPGLKGEDGKDNNPTKERVGDKGYDFKGWSLTAPGEGEQKIETSYTITKDNLANPIFYAVYDEFDYYTVRFVDEKGNDITYKDETSGKDKTYTRDDYRLNEEVEAPVLPDKDSTVSKTTKFVAWCDVVTGKCYEIEKGLPNVTANVTYKPVYEEKTRQYTLTFKNIGVKNAAGETENATLYTVTLDYGTNIYNWIQANIDKEVSDAEDAKTLRQLIEANVPTSNDSYTYSFDPTVNWSPRINAETTVTGDATYTATYTTAPVLYPVYWLIEDGEDTEGNATYKNYETTNYTYKSNISIPSKMPTMADPKDTEYPEETYTWGFLGWYLCDKDGNIQKDESGAEIKFVKGTKAENREGVYYVAKFGYSPKEFDIKIYDSDKTTLLETIPGNAFGEDVTINLSKYNNKLKKGVYTPDDEGNTTTDEATHHYNVASLTVMGDYAGGIEATPPSYGVDGECQITYKVGSTNELYINYVAVPHEFTEWQTTTPADYEKDGEEERHCQDCGYSATSKIEMLNDTTAPVGNISTGSNKWTDNLDKTGVAYVKKGAIVSIIARDLGDATTHQRQTAGVGIKAIYYRWSDEIIEATGDDETAGATGDETAVEPTLEDKLLAEGWKEADITTTKYKTLNATFDFILPEKDFVTKDIYLEAKVYDYNDRELEITTPILRIDEDAPVLEIEAECGSLEFEAGDFNEIGEVKIEKLDTETNKYVALSDDEYEVVIGVEDEETETIDYRFAGGKVILPDGTYRITVSDKAGNETIKKVTVAKGHKFTKDDGEANWVVDKEATCTEKGSKHKECTICGASENMPTEIEAKGHNIKDVKFTVDKEATCTEKGSESQHCKTCGEKCNARDIEAKGHKEKITSYSEPTCTKDGYKIKTCENCNDLWELITKEEDATLAAKGHTEKETKTEEATCSKAGRTYKICATCEAEYDEKPIAQKEHKWELTTTGKCKDESGRFYTVNECSVCGEKNVANDDLKDHSYNEVVYTAPTCKDNGYWTYTCTVCGDTYKKEDRETEGKHNLKLTAKVDPKCEAEGTEAYYECTVCNALFSDAEGTKSITAPVTIPALGHHWVEDTEKSKAPTCKNDGLKVEYCDNKDCKETQKTTIKSTGAHNYATALTGEGNYQAPTCENKGWQKFQCTGCDLTETKDIDATGHKQGAEVSRTAATCKAEGSVTYNCLNGDHTYTVTLPIDPNAHDVSEGATVVKVTKKATCTEKGAEIRNCKLCGATATFETPELGHEYNWVVTKEATCVDKGEETSICSRCNEIELVAKTDEDGNEVVDEEGNAEMIENKRDIATLGSHDLELHAKVDPKCEAEGTEAYYECKVCEKLFEDAEAKTSITAPKKIDATGHTYDKDGEDDKYVVVAPTCSKDGYKYKVCTVCGDKTAPEATGEKALNHAGATHTLVKVNKAATCKATGEGVYQCSLCGNTFIKQIAIDENAHSAVWSTTAASCEKAGKREKVCDICKNTIETVEIPALGHSYKVTTETRYDDGKIETREVKTCTRCGKSENGKWGVTGEACKVTFEVVDGGKTTTSEITKDKNSKLKKSDLPTVDLTSTKDGYAKSITWTVAGKEVSFPLEITGNITVIGTVKEYELTYTVAFVHTLSKDTLSSKTYKYGEKIAVPDDLSVAGYTFGGWSVSPSDSTVPVYGKDTIPEALADGKGVTADVTYYAVFTAVEGAKTYYVTFKNGTKTFDSQIVTSGGTAVAPTNTPKKDSNTVFHYTFAGWTDKEGKAVTFPMTNVTTNVTVYAKFTDVKHADCKDPTYSKVVPATCTDTAHADYKCKDCGYTWSQDTAEPLGHDYKEVDGSRVDDGGKVTVTYKCTRCEATWTKTVVYNASANIVVITVKDASGNAVEGATVQVYLGELQTVTATTDAKGQAKFPKYDAETAPNGLKDGNYTVKVTKTGYNTASGSLVVKDGSGSVNLTFSKIDCHCICHSSNFFGKIRRFFNKFFRLFNKNYTCCDCGECEVIH